MFHAFKKDCKNIIFQGAKNSLQLSLQGIQQVFGRSAATTTTFFLGPAGEATEAMVAWGDLGPRLSERILSTLVMLRFK